MMYSYTACLQHSRKNGQTKRKDRQGESREKTGSIEKLEYAILFPQGKAFQEYSTDQGKVRAYLMNKGCNTVSLNC